MKPTQKNVKALQQLAAASKYNTEQTNEVIQLYQNRKIERFDTAKCIINNLASRGKQRQNKGLDKLDYYKNINVSLSDKCNAIFISLQVSVKSCEVFRLYNSIFNTQPFTIIFIYYSS